MNRRTFLQAVGATAASVGLHQAAIALEVPATVPSTMPSTGAGITHGPLLTNVGDTGVTLIAAVDVLSTLAIEYGTTAQLGQTSIGCENGLASLSKDVHKIRLTGLAPGTEYFYRVRLTRIEFKNAYSVKRADETVTEIRKFRTLQPGQATCTFSVINDTHETQDTMTTLAGRLKSTPVDFAFWNGDVFNQMNEPNQLARQLVGFMGDNAVTSAQPMHLLRGNHDVRGILSREIDRYTDISGGRYYGSFRQGPVAFITLDSGEDKPDTHPVYAGLNDFDAFRTQQRDWLATELIKPHITSAAFRVVFVHIPLRWTDESEAGSWCRDGRSKWHDLLATAGVDVVISGHTHRNAFLPADGQFPYAQLIGGGPRLETATFIQAHADEKRLTLQVTQATGEAIGEHVFDRKNA